MSDDLYAGAPERIDQYGRPSKWFLDYPPDYLDALVREVKALELIFRVEFGLQIYLTWGTLLGAMRAGDLIPHDFDIDVGYVSRARSKAGVLRERARIFDHFDAYGRVLSGSEPGRFMLRANLSPEGTYAHGIEVYASFVTGGRFYGYPTLPGTLSRREVRPFRDVTLRGLTFKAPRRADLFLEQAMGADWRVPKLPKDHKVTDGWYRCFDFLYRPG